MKKTHGTLAALSALTASIALHPTDATANTAAGTGQMQDLAQNIDQLRDQCDYIWNNRTDFDLLTEELNRILTNSPDARSCDDPMSAAMRQTCEEQCTGLILALLGGDPVAQIPDDVEPY
ncbi:MAG: hypothetical protein ACOCY0_03450 [Roseicyclus sp.]